LPKNDPVFLTALKHVVEIGQDGEVLGLVKLVDSDVASDASSKAT
jgi:hypothetical protein